MGILDFLPAVMRRAEPAKVQRSEPVMARVPFQGMPMRQNQRAYSGAMFDRLTADWVAGSTSQDSETYSSLRQLRNRARQLVRDNDYAKNAKRSVQNNVVGTGMKLQPKIKLQRGGGLNKVANQAICDAWADWCVADSCDVAGKLSFSDIERMAIGGTAESGEIFVRIVRQKFGDSRIPFALEVIEADQCIDTKNGSTAGGGLIRMGVEMNQWKRPTGYWFWPNHPGDYNFAQNNTQRELFASAADVVHLYVSDRPGQTRGISWFHTAVKRLHHMEGYEEAEVIAQRANSSVMGFVTSAETGDVPDDTVVDGTAVDELEPGQIKHLNPGEDFKGFTPPRNAVGMDPFMRQMLRGVAAGIGASYETISKDYSQSNYSSSRLALLDDRDTWRVIQRWMIGQFHRKIFAEWLLMAVLAGEVVLPGYETNPKQYLRQIHWQARGWGFVDPEKEVNAYKAAVRAGINTLEEVIEQGAGGGHVDYDEKMDRIEAERKDWKDRKIVLDVDPSQVDDKGASQKAFSTDAGQPALAAPAAAAAPDTTTKPVQIDPAASGDAPGNAPKGTAPQQEQKT